MKHIIALSLLLFICSALGTAQVQPKPQTDKADEVVVVNTNLVQVDAVVTDKSGRQVTNLRPEDFELLESGRPREIKAFSFIPLTSEQPAPDETGIAQSRKGLPPLTLHAERPEGVRRVIAILIDDYGLSFESVVRLRDSLAKFIQQETSPSDLIAVIRASGGPGAMQQFTSNRSQLLATVRGMRWYPTGRGGIAASESFSPIDNDENGLELQGYSNNRTLNLAHKEYFPGSLSSLAFVINGLTRFPGRKSVVVVSDNLPLTNKSALIQGVTRALDKLIEVANQNQIVISTMDARSLPKAGLTADDSQYNLTANQVDARTRIRMTRFTADQDAMSYLAQQTGGVFVRDDNDLTHALRRIVDSEQGYYLIGFRPDDLEGKPGSDRTYKVTLRLKRPELQVRTRSAYHRIERAGELADTHKGKTEFLREALSSPFVREGVHLKVTALYIGSSQIKILLHVDARDIELNMTPQHTYEGSFDVAAVAFDNNGKVAQETSVSPIIRIAADGYERLQRYGFNYVMTLPMNKSGSYQVRLALRDAATGRLGSDSQFVEVPDLNTNRLTVAGFVVQGEAAEKDHPLDDTNRESSNPLITAGRETASRGPAVRQFMRGDLLTYSYLIYGTRPNRVPDSNLVSQVRLFRGDREMFRGNVQPVATAPAAGHNGIVAMGNLRLGKELAPGEYFLQVVVTDKLAPPEKQTSDQWIDFQIVE